MRDITSVSIAIVTRNRCDLLERAIKSALSQGYPIDEIIVVDNNSSDSTVRTAKNSDNVKLIRLDENIGCPPARNVAMENSESELVLHLDDDGVLKNRAVESAVRVYEESDDVGVVALNVLEDGENSLKGISKGEKLCRFSGGACLISNKCWNKVGTYDNALFRQAEEYDYSLRLLHNDFTIRACPSATMHHLPPNSTKHRYLCLKMVNRTYVLLKNYPLSALVLLAPRRLFGFFILFILHRSARAFIRCIYDNKNKLYHAFRNRKCLVQGTLRYHELSGDIIISGVLGLSK